ncbi:methyltransferase domain-containing protein [Alphaproteobacteria bacterium]|nr:methyltransferase domain-containing protein [Alphaproteobacteria bacterium]
MNISSVDEIHLKKIRQNIEQLHLKFSKKLDKNKIKILDVAPEIYEGARKYFKVSTVDTLDIDPHSGADIIADLSHCPTVEDNSYDLVFCTEVLEHTATPQFCVDTLYRILRPNGTLIVTTPFNFRIHNPLPDFWRFTEHGLRLMFNNSGFQKIEISGVESDRFLMPIQYIVSASK